MLAFVFYRELGAQNFFLVSNQIRHYFAIERVYKPDHVIFASSHEYGGLVMPLNKVQVLLRDILQRFLECEAVLHVPHSQEIVHSAGDKPFPRRIELAKFNCLGVPRKLTDFLYGVLEA